MIERIRTFLSTHHLLRPDALLLVAVSGGPDSLCLLHLLKQVHATGGPKLHVAHLDHGLRGAQSAAEAHMVANLAAAWDIPATVEYRDLAALPRAKHTSLLAAARQVRYTLFASIARTLGASALAVAHQADDQAETLLLHLLRGAGLAGLRAMRPVVPWAEWAATPITLEHAALSRMLTPIGTPCSAICNRQSTIVNGITPHEVHASQPEATATCPPLIRPLLTTSRNEILAYCTTHNLQPADDPSNRSPHYTRARVRQLLPQLTKENPQLVSTLGRTAHILGDDYDYIQQQLSALWPSLARSDAGVVALQRERWLTLHPAMQRHALRRAAASLGAYELSLQQLEAARTLATRPGHQMQLTATLRLMVDQNDLILALPQAQPYPAHPQLTQSELPLLNPGTTPIGHGWYCQITDTPPAQPDRWWLQLDPQLLDGPLSLRCRRPGDRFHPRGAPGSRKLQDFFVDQKLPQSLRAAWPLLVTPSSIVWVVGLRPAAPFSAHHQHQQPTIWVGCAIDLGAA
ncbi:tRNA lysidine(34) synthetase TilS [Candidatus Viridilinea mediisalina]|uniref:tRNA(Ile)-lysidine synthase n=1 Tax=Candidatus Viridilinea mediisalina TaxID=2024553 RepID=A0A2A6REI9_9CHLR|nr:tRNA lysidine(34) synthetase TilS [Candidatus Viridilinea mediisalina]PDW01534.1 tRNA lysidine(34) synthetase TilS [Candidatus Viridilinea mediisalina]